MKTIFVDFEMNPINSSFKEARQICKNEIIEIGAVLLNEDGKEISSYCQYVKPEYNQITEKYARLTGVTNLMVQIAPTFKKAIFDFLMWIEKESQNDDVVIYSWSDNDYRQIMQEVTLKNMELGICIGLATEWQDYQREFCDLLGFEKIISLESAMNAIGENFIGRMHDALWDARNTASIYALSKDIDEFNRIMKPIIDAMKPSAPMTFCLGDLFADKLKGICIAS
jgi:inhibitor of KinA sporulation pathway (predicted exonuclease)